MLYRLAEQRGTRRRKPLFGPQPSPVITAESFLNSRRQAISRVCRFRKIHRCLIIGMAKIPQLD
jgi:hypothetical protein